MRAGAVIARFVVALGFVVSGAAGVGRVEAAPLVGPDPAVAGPLTPVRVEYNAGPTTVNDPKGLPLYPAQIAGVLWHPKTMDGSRPVVLLLHGNHGTCDVVGAGGSAYPCPSTGVTEPHPNYAGYDYLASNLASHGYITLSVDANAVNTYNVGGDKGANERAQLLARTLDALARWNEGPGPGDIGGALIGHVDLSRIGMMGHSRGGEGVTNFLDYIKVRTDGPRYKVAAVFALAGTDYNLPSAEGAAFGNLLPLCDGDVYDLQSSFAWDRGHVQALSSEYPRVQFAVQGTNHNYFNTEWESDDFAGRPTDSACEPTSKTSNRLSPADQRRVGLDVIAAFMRRYVGDEMAFDRYMTGAAAFPSSVCPGGVGTCPNLIGQSYIAPASQRRYLVSPAMAGDTLHVSSEGAPITASDLQTFTFCDPHADTGTDGNNRDPGLRSGCPTNPNRTRVRQLTIGRNRASSLTIPLVAHDVRRFEVLSMRVGVNFQDERNPAGVVQDFRVELVDGAGHAASVSAGAVSNALRPPPGDAARAVTLNGVRIPLDAFTGVDLADVRAVRLRFGAEAGPATGAIQLSQLALQGAAPAEVAGALLTSGESLPATGGGPAWGPALVLAVLLAVRGAQRLATRSDVTEVS